MKTTLRYLLSVIAIMGVLGVNAQTPKYGKPYPSHNGNAKYTTASEYTLPTAAIGSVNSDHVQSGSNLPQAAVTGATTTSDSRNNAPGGPRKGSWNPGEEPGPDEGDNTEPWADPIGDGMWPLMVLACAYFKLHVMRTRKRV